MAQAHGIVNGSIKNIHYALAQLALVALNFLPDNISPSAALAIVQKSVPGTTVFNGHFNGTVHSWLKISGGTVIIDVYPQFAAGTLLVDTSASGPWNSLYTA
jgi:hypothetical protein